MPIEVRELVIKANIDGKQSREAASSASGGGGNGANQAEIVQQCVDMVLAILRRERER